MSAADNHRNRALGALLLITALASGCATTPPAPPAAGEAPVVSGRWVTAADDQAVQAGWLARLDVPELPALVDEALAHNYDLQIAAARLSAAEAAARKASAAFIPAVDLGAGVTRGGNLDSGDSARSALGVSLDVSWEADLWGRVRSGAAGARAGARASALDLEAARLSVAAQVAKAWFVAVEAGRQHDLAGKSVADLAETLHIVEVRFNEGMVSQQDVQLARTDLALAHEQLTAADNARIEARRALELVLGRYPAAELEVNAGMPVLTAMPAAGLPAGLLERRPDLRAAEARVAAAFALAEQARAARLPRINLVSSLGFASDALRTLADPVNSFWTVGVNLLQPLIDGGRLQADVEIADARQREAVAFYARQAQQAFAEVERSLTAAGSLQARADSLRAAAQSAQAAHRLVSLRYQAGESDLLNVLEAHRRWLAARQGLLRVQLAQLLERVNLHLALGGDFQ